MALRYNALVLAVIATFVAIVGLWGGDAVLAGVWRVPVGLLLLGLAYERWLVSRAQLELKVEQPRQCVLGRAGLLRLEFTHRLRRSVDVEFVVAERPEAVEIDGAVRTLRIPAGQSAAAAIEMTPRRLGAHAWPAIRVRVAGPFGLAWWTKTLPAGFTLQDDARHPAGRRRSGWRRLLEDCASARRSAPVLKCCN